MGGIGLLHAGGYINFATSYKIRRVTVVVPQIPLLSQSLAFFLIRALFVRIQRLLLVNENVC